MTLNTKKLSFFLALEHLSFLSRKWSFWFVTDQKSELINVHLRSNAGAKEFILSYSIGTYIRVLYDLFKYCTQRAELNFTLNICWQKLSLGWKRVPLLTLDQLEGCAMGE